MATSDALHNTILATVEASDKRDLGPAATALAASWERSMKYGLRREDRALFNNNVSAQAVKRIAEENNFLVGHARPEMVKLYEVLGSARWLALCVNARGEIVCSVGNRTSAPRELRVLMQPGRVIAEAELGTTAPGCVLAERRASVVTRGEHYLMELESFFCASAPIYAPTGALAGALDISGIDVASIPLAADMVNFAVRRIENSLLSSLDNCMQLRFHVDERLLATPFEGMMSIGPDATVRGLNRTACQLLSLTPEDAVGMPVDAIFDRGLEGVLQHMRRAGSQPVRIRGHRGTFSCVGIDPAAARTVRAPASHSRQHSASGESGLIIKDPTLAASYEKAERVLHHGLPVILEGETGTGKEMIARALHDAVRPGGPFLAINCAAIPETLIEAELFGYADGAFTGGRKGGAPGKIEQAHEGVLFLDEIGDMPASLQTRLLRVLQERSVTRIGESRENPVDMRVICATHRDIDKLIKSGLFREDLYYRLNGYALRIPALRERTDIADIIEAFFIRWAASDAAADDLARSRLVTSAALRCLASYHWPGNIRELEYTIRALLALRSNEMPIDSCDLPPHICNHAPDSAEERESSPAVEGGLLQNAQLEAIRKVVGQHRGNISAAAKALGISRGTIYSKLRRSKRH